MVQTVAAGPRELSSASEMVFWTNASVLGPRNCTTIEQDASMRRRNAADRHGDEADRLMAKVAPGSDVVGNSQKSKRGE